MNVYDAAVLDLTTSPLKDRQVWLDLAEAFDQVIKANVDDPSKQLELLRYLPPTADQSVLADACRLLGFDLSQDILNMSIESFCKIATQLGMYPDSNGTEAFTKFISLMINGFCEVSNLWTKDYVNFYTEPRGTTIDEGGKWFKTTHVELAMGFLTLAGLQLKQGETLYSKIKDIFYQQAPIALVIDRSVFVAYVQVEDLAFGATVLPPERVYYLR